MLPPGAKEHYYWINRRVENRPTAILSHNILQIANPGAVIVGRQFYDGHSYNSSHSCVGMLPYRDGTLVYYVESSSTDQVAGIASGLKHAIAREQLKEQMIKHLEQLGRNFQAVSKANKSATLYVYLFTFTPEELDISKSRLNGSARHSDCIAYLDGEIDGRLKLNCRRSIWRSNRQQWTAMNNSYE